MLRETLKEKGRISEKELKCMRESALERGERL